MDPRYIVIEIQTNSDNTIGTQVTSFVDLPHAENKYHYVLSAASVSKKPIHACVLMDAEGSVQKSEFYRHEEEEPEQNEGE